MRERSLWRAYDRAEPTLQTLHSALQTDECRVRSNVRKLDLRFSQRYRLVDVRPKLRGVTSRRTVVSRLPKLCHVSLLFALVFDLFIYLIFFFRFILLYRFVPFLINLFFYFLVSWQFFCYSLSSSIQFPTHHIAPLVFLKWNFLRHGSASSPHRHWIETKIETNSAPDTGETGRLFRFSDREHRCRLSFNFECRLAQSP
jgi:hypothetical protein